MRIEVGLLPASRQSALAALLVTALCASSPALAEDSGPELPVEAASGIAGEASALNERRLRYTLGLSSSTKNLSVGVSAGYWGYFNTTVETDLFLTMVVTGLMHDDLDGLRLAVGQTLGGRLSFAPFRFTPRYGPRAYRGAGTYIDVGLGAWGLLEMDSMSQAFRTGDAGYYTGLMVGPFASISFSDLTVTLMARPFSQSAFSSGGVGGSTAFEFVNPTLDVNLTYTFPW